MNRNSTKIVFGGISLFSLMRSITLILFLASGLWCIAQDYEAIVKSEKEAYRVQHAKHKRSGQRYDLTYQKLNLKIDPDVRDIRGSVYSEFTALEDQFSNLAFDLDNRMTVDSVWVNGVISSFLHIGDEVRITTPLSDSGDRLSTEVFYGGDPSVNEQKGFSYGAQADGAIAWTLSEPYGAYGWWPCKQQLHDKIDSVDMTVTVPSGNKVAGLGMLVDQDTVGPQWQFSWEHRYPTTTYLVAVAVTHYDEHNHYIHFPNGDSLYYLDYMYPAYSPIAEGLRNNIDGMMVLFDTLFGPYPFMGEKYGHAQFGRGGGMEHQTMSFMSDLSFDLMAHELAHQWYGNKITCGSWRDLWLNEGFATYSNALAREHMLGKELFLEFMQISRDRVFRQTDGAVYAYDTTNFNVLFSGNIRYRKGAMVLQMLRWEMGDKAFYSALRKYTADADLCYDFAHTPDFQYYLEQEHSEDLDSFFHRWVYSEGFPILTTRWRRATPESIEIDISQTTSHPSVSFYPLMIQYRAVGEDRDTLIVVDHTTSGQTELFDLGFEVKELIFDPNVWILAQNTTVEGSHINVSAPISVYPNPADGVLNLYVEDKKVDRYAIVDILGRAIAEAKTPELRNHIIQIPTNELTAGQYFLTVYIGDELFTARFQVLHD